MAANAQTLPRVQKAVARTLQQVGGLKVYDHSPRAYDRLPAVEIGLLDARRIDVDEAESELGRVDWFLDFPLTLHVRVGSGSALRETQLNALELLGEIVGEFDKDTSVIYDSPGVLDAK